MAPSFDVPVPCQLSTTSASGVLQLITTSRRAETRSGAASASATATEARRARWRDHPRSGRGSLSVRRSHPARTPRRHLAQGPQRLPVRSRLGTWQSGDPRPSISEAGGLGHSLLHQLPTPGPAPLLLLGSNTALIPSGLPVSHLLLSPQPFTIPTPPRLACRHSFPPHSCCLTCWH